MSSRGIPSSSLCPGAQSPWASLAHVLGRKFPNIEEQLESPSIQLLEKKKEVNIVHQAMQQQKEVGSHREQGRRGHRAQGEPEDSPPFCGWLWLQPGVLGGAGFPLWRQKRPESWGHQGPGYCVLNQA